MPPIGEALQQTDCRGAQRCMSHSNLTHAWMGKRGVLSVLYLCACKSDEHYLAPIIEEPPWRFWERRHYNADCYCYNG